MRVCFPSLFVCVICFCLFGGGSVIDVASHARLFDTDNTGEINSSELGALLHTMGHTLDHAHLQDMMRRLDRDGSGTVSFDEWRYYTNNWSS